MKSGWHQMSKGERERGRERVKCGGIQMWYYHILEERNNQIWRRNSSPRAFFSHFSTVFNFESHEELWGKSDWEETRQAVRLLVQKFACGWHVASSPSIVELIRSCWGGKKRTSGINESLLSCEDNLKGRGDVLLFSSTQTLRVVKTGYQWVVCWSAKSGNEREEEIIM